MGTSVRLPYLPVSFDIFERLAFAVASCLLLVPHASDAQSLGGSAASLDRQNAQARAHDFTYLETPFQVRRFVDSGYLVPIVPNRDMELHQVSFPYARPEVRLFIDRLSRQYRSACGETLVVTSLTRPLSEQPRNASDRSVHPTGMAIDLRRSNRSSCRRWLESTLMTLEGRGVLEATRERSPPHYHLALYPSQYAQYVARLTGNPDVLASSNAREPSLEVQRFEHTVRRGESLSTIADRYEVPVGRIRAENGIRGDRILVGQALSIPVYRVAPTTPSETVAALPEDRSPATGGADPAPEPASEEVAHHTVARGESLWTIARAYGVREEAIRAVNGVRGSRILIGEVLTIPVSGAQDGVVRYRVEEGESLWTIANRHGTTVAELRRTNGIRTSRIYPGQTLNVPYSF